MPDTTTSSYAVTGMTCGHCALSVREAVEQLPGVTGVAVSVREGSLTITSTERIHRDAVAMAVHDAGYEVTQ